MDSPRQKAFSLPLHLESVVFLSNLCSILWSAKQIGRSPAGRPGRQLSTLVVTDPDRCIRVGRIIHHQGVSESVSSISGGHLVFCDLGHCGALRANEVSRGHRGCIDMRFVGFVGRIELN